MRSYLFFPYIEKVLDSFPLLANLRTRDFFERFPNTDILFESVLHDHGHMFKEALFQFMSSTESFT